MVSGCWLCVRTTALLGTTHCRTPESHLHVRNDTRGAVRTRHLATPSCFGYSSRRLKKRCSCHHDEEERSGSMLVLKRWHSMRDRISLRSGGARLGRPSRSAGRNKKQAGERAAKTQMAALLFLLFSALAWRWLAESCRRSGHQRTPELRSRGISSQGLRPVSSSAGCLELLFIFEQLCSSGE